jgi:hypothetical protein
VPLQLTEEAQLLVFQSLLRSLLRTNRGNKRIPTTGTTIRNHWQHFTQQHDTHTICVRPLWPPRPDPLPLPLWHQAYCPTFLPPSRPHAAEMYKRISTFSSPTGILQLANHNWTIHQPHHFFGHSYSSPTTPSISTLQALGLCISKSFAAHIRYEFSQPTESYVETCSSFYVFM